MTTDATAKPAYAEYPTWLKTNHGVMVDERLRNRYTSVATSILHAFSTSALWLDCLRELREFDAEYQVAHGYVLLDPNATPELKIKPWKSFLLKTYRKNVSENPSWPAAPRQGWILPGSAGIPSINDVVRTYFVVKYLDGVEFLVERLGVIALRHGAEFQADLEAREEGYYAAHAYVTRAFEVPAEKWDTDRIAASIELQVTTQVQELIQRLLHQHYEERRAAAKPPAAKWQWDYTSQEFSTNYLGHILHYVEGMIMDIREKQEPGGVGR